MSDTKYAEIKETPVASTSRGRRERPLSPTLDEQMDVDDTNGVDADEDEEEDDDDPVVRRLPVYYTPEYIQSLCLLQYPDRPPRPETHHPLLPPTLEPDWQNDDSPAVGRLVAKYKPQTQHLEVTVPMEKDPERWNEDNAKRFATGVIEDKDKEREKDAQKKGGRRKKRDPAEDEAEQRYREEKEARRLDKMVYASTGVPEVTSYLIGVVRNDALHLNPINQTFQLRPSLTYLDQILANERRAKRAAEQNDDDDDDEVSETEMKKEQAKAVQVSIKQQEGQAKGPLGGGNGRAGASLFAPLRAEEAEEWKPLKHFHANTDAARDAFDRMCAPSKTKLTSITKPKEYLAA